MSPTEILFSNFENLKIENTSLLLMLQKELEIKKYYESENSRLLEMLRDLKRQKFGPRSERWESEEQLVFNEAEMLARLEALKKASEEAIEVKPHLRERGKRKPLPENLPREIVLIELPENERVGEDGRLLKPIGKEVSEKLFFEPAVMKVIEYHRIRYGADGGDTGIIAKPLPSIIPKGIVTPSLLSHIVMQKFGYGMPFYRQEDMFKRMGVEIPRCTQARWVIQSAEVLRPLWNILEERLMASTYVACDETWTQVLKEKDKSPESKSWMWVRATPGDKKKIILFDYDPARSGAVAKKLFSEYRGRLQVDGYGAYDALEKQKDLIRFGCNMHGRRKFESALVTGAEAGKTLAEVAMKYYGQIYDVEREARNLSYEDRFNLRNLKAVPIWEEFKLWADLNYPKVPPKSKIGEAFHYFINEYKYLIGYLQDGMLEADNGFCERAIKNFAIGRKNWLFSDSTDGAEASALYYSIVVTAKINGNDPQKVLTQIFEQIPFAKTIDDFERITDLIMSQPTAH